MARPSKGEFTPKNPSKYSGKLPIVYRSSWEMTLMTKFDTHPNVLQWESESLSIPYQNPLTKKWSMYIPDFLVVYIDKSNKKWVEMIEVKPSKEDPRYEPKILRNGQIEKISKRTQLVQMINAAKWNAAVQYCAKKRWTFRVLTEKEMFAYKRKT